MCATIEEIMTLSKIPFQKLFRALQNHKFWVTKLKYVNTHSLELLLNIFWSHFTIYTYETFVLMTLQNDIEIHRSIPVQNTSYMPIFFVRIQ